MKVFVSHSFGTDEIVARSLNKAIQQAGHEAFEHDALTRQLRCVEAGGDDRVDLDMAFRRAGYPSSTQERSDPMMFERLIAVIGGQDALVVLWSKDYARKYWTRIEWKTALAMCKPLVVVQMDDAPMATDLRRALDGGKLSVIQFDQHYRPQKVIRFLGGMTSIPKGQFMGEVHDEESDHRFVKLKHPFLGDIEIGKYQVTNHDVLNMAPDLFPTLTQSSTAGRLPVTNVTWQKACALCQAMGKTGRERYFRLPTEIEWEFSARSGELTVSGLHMNDFQRYAVLSAQAPLTVGSREPNGWGLFDVVGNVAEWCLDAGELLEINGWVQPVEGRELGRAHIVRGAWFRAREGHRSSVSYPYPQLNDMCSEAIGMRLVRERTREKVGAHS